MTWATPNLNRLLPKIGRIIWNCTFQQYHVILDSHFSANSSQITFAKTRFSSQLRLLKNLPLSSRPP